jgi:hypothetical protein
MRRTLMTAPLKTVILLAIAAIASAPAFAKCDISTLACWGSGSKCNIHFKNHTGLATGDSGGTYNQTSAARNIRVWAETKSGDRVSGRKLINAGDKKTINLDKAKNFDHIEIKQDDLWKKEPKLYSVIKCPEIQRILQGEGTCHIWLTTSQQKPIAFSCNGKSIIGRGSDSNYEVAK